MRTGPSPIPEEGLEEGSGPTLVGRLLVPLGVLAGAFLLWEAVVRLRDVPIYLVPAPSAVFRRLLEEPGYFLKAGLVTLQEALLGFALGSAVAFLLATAMAHSRPLERGLLPLAILVKVTPIVAVAPVLTVLLGFGPLPKVIIAALLTFFPVLVGGITGLRSPPAGALDLLRSLRASPWEVFIKLRLPSSLPYLFAAFKVSITLSVIGAAVAEWTGAAGGLGRAIWLSYTDLNMPTLFAAVLVLAVLGIGLYALVAVAERRLLFWHESAL
ncbi:MAG TPA: ABC transporter permease [Dehalococcoidia bacterium]|nr:ABC transporter permease [Dehalococcoidia bacterium]